MKKNLAECIEFECRYAHWHGDIWSEEIECFKKTSGGFGEYAGGCGVFQEGSRCHFNLTKKQTKIKREETKIKREYNSYDGDDYHVLNITSGDPYYP